MNHERFKMRKLYELIKKASELDPATNEQIYLFLGEENGEIGTCLAVEAGLKHRDLEETTWQECVDVIVSTLALIHRYNISYEEFEEYLKKKGTKYLEGATQRKTLKEFECLLLQQKKK